MKEIREAIGYNQLYFLKKQDFRGSFLREYMDFLTKISDGWYGIHYEFNDPRINKMFRDFVDDTIKLTTELVKYTSIIKGDVVTLLTEKERKYGELDSETREAIAGLNSNAGKLADKYENFERTSRKLLPNAF